LAVLDPNGSALRWAAHKSRDRIKGFLLGGIVFSIVAATVSSILHEPKHASLADHVANAALGVLAAVIVVAVIGLGSALILAPYEQRNQLRNDLNAAEARIEAITSTDIQVTFGDPEQKGSSISLPFTNNGKGAGNFVVMASNVKAAGFHNHFDPFAVRWDGSGEERHRLKPGDRVNLSLCSVMPTRLGPSKQTWKVTFVSSPGNREMSPAGDVTLDLEAKGEGLSDTQWAKVTLRFTETSPGFLEFKGAECEPVSY
jgi:hypothetical protein